ncbi:helix-turn-helix domain-containing protein, partial [Enterococcus faecalis]
KVVKAIKEEFYTVEFKNPGWKNEVGYPCEEFMDDYFYDLQQEVIKEEIQKMVRDQIKKLRIADELSKQNKDE